MNPEHMVDSSFLGRVEFGQRNEVGHFGEMVSMEMDQKWSAVRIMVLPLEGGRPVTKSRARCDQGREGMGKGLSRPTDTGC